MSTRILFSAPSWAWPGLVNGADLVDVSASAEEPAMPAALLKTPTFSEQWRATGVASIEISFQFSEPRPVALVALAYHNFPDTAQIAIELRFAGTPVYVSEPEPASPVANWGELAWGAFPLGALAEPPQRETFFHPILETPSLGRHPNREPRHVTADAGTLRIDGLDPSSHAQAAMLHLGPVHQPSVSYARDIELSPEIENLHIRRAQRLSLGFPTRADVRWFETWQTRYPRHPLAVIPRPDAPATWRHRAGFWIRQDGSVRGESAVGRYDKLTLDLLEWGRVRL